MRNLTILLFLLISTNLFADKIEGHIFEVNKDIQTPLPGASVYWKNTSLGTISDKNGFFNIDKSKKTNILVIAFVGYKTQEIAIKKQTKITITLDPNIELNEIIVSKQKKGVILDRTNPIQSQNITGAELCKAACCNLSESFETNASVDVSYADAATGAKSIKLLGLTGKYIEMMSEKNPNFKGLASVYGMTYVPGPWMESIQISKGVGSVINGYESITGQINIEYKKPSNSPKLFLNTYANSVGMSEANIISGVKIKDNLSTSILAHFQNNNKEMDKNKDNFLDEPMLKQQNIINRWQWKPNKNWNTQFGIKFIDEKRIGGQKAYDTSKTNDINNAYRINIKTRRYEAFAKLGFILPSDSNKSIALIANYSDHKQNSFYGLKDYNAKQNNFYTSILFQSYIGNLKHKYTAGLTFSSNKFSDKLSNIYTSDVNENVAGAYLEYTWLPSDKLSLQTGIRYDNHSIYGGFITPRLHIRYDIADQTTLRIAAGNGRRTSHAIAENSFLLASSRKFKVDKNLEQEMAWNYGVSMTKFLSLWGRDVIISTDFYRTDFKKQIIVDLDKNTHEVNIYNLDGQSYANNYQIELKIEAIDRLNITSAIRFSDVKANINQELQRVPYINRYKGLLNLSYSSNMNKWQFDFTTQFNGKSRIPSTQDNPIKYRRENESPQHTLMNAQITKRFRIWEIYGGCENIGNYTQKNPIIAVDNPFGEHFDASMVWGPIQERKFYLGLRFTID